MNLSKKIELSGEILRFASEKSQEYYQKPLVFVKSGDKRDKVIEDLIKTFLNDNEYEISNSFINRRLCIFDGKEAFGIKGKTNNKYYSFEYTKEVFREATNDAVWDCLLVTAMRSHANTLVNPLIVFTEQEITEW